MATPPKGQEIAKKKDPLQYLERVYGTVIIRPQPVKRTTRVQKTVDLCKTMANCTNYFFETRCAAASNRKTLHKVSRFRLESTFSTRSVEHVDWERDHALLFTKNVTGFSNKPMEIWDNRQIMRDSTIPRRKASEETRKEAEGRKKEFIEALVESYGTCSRFIRSREERAL